MDAEEARLIDARVKIVKPRVEEVTPSLDTDRDVVITRFEALHPLERNRDHTTPLFDEDPHERLRLREDLARARCDRRYSVLHADARTFEHREHALAAEGFEEIVERAELERCHCVAIVSGREDDVWAAIDLLCHRDSGSAGHSDIEEEEVGPYAVDHADRREAVADFVHLADPVDALEMLAQHAARERLVVCDHYARFIRHRHPHSQCEGQRTTLRSWPDLTRCAVAPFLRTRHRDARAARAVRNATRSASRGRSRRHRVPAQTDCFRP